MEVGHDEKADDAGDDTEELDAFETTDTVGEAVSDFLVEDDGGSASGKDEST